MPMSAAAVRAMTITSKEQLKNKFELLQLMRDMLGYGHWFLSIVFLKF